MRKKGYLKWWKDRNSILYYGERSHRRITVSFYDRLGFPYLDTHPLEAFLKGYWEEEGDRDEALSNKKFVWGTLRGDFPLLHKDGGITEGRHSKLTDLKAMETFINFPVIRINLKR